MKRGSCIGVLSRICVASILGMRQWGASAGYVDGDGTVEELVGRFVVEVRLGSSDNWLEQPMTVRDSVHALLIGVGMTGTT
jgi:hypothetical protein